MPAIDSVLFAAPKTSVIDIVQAAGRALRRHDDTLAAGLGAARADRASSPGRRQPELPGQVIVHAPPGTVAQALDALRIRIVDGTTPAWQDGYGHACAYHAAHGSLHVAVGAVEAMREAVPLFGRAPHARPGDPAAERRVLAASGRGDAAWRDGNADGSRRQPGPGSGMDRQAEQHGHRIAGQLQAHALAERGYALSQDELATTLGATTTLPGDVIDRLARTNRGERTVAVADRARADELSSRSAVPSLSDGVAHGEHLTAAGQDSLMAGTASMHASSDRTAAQLAAENFPCTATDAVMAAATAGTQAGRSAARTNTTPRIQRSGRSA